MTKRLCTVYFMRQKGVARGPVKIGCSSYVPGRLDSLSVWSPVELEVAATFPGGVREERRMHWHFHANRTHHEWFNWAPEIEAVIASINAGTFDIEMFPNAPKMPSERQRAMWTPARRVAQSVNLRIEALAYRGMTREERSEGPSYYAFDGLSGQDLEAAHSQAEAFIAKMQEKYPPKGPVKLRLVSAA